MSLSKTAFSSRDEKVFVISALGHDILAIYGKVEEFDEKSAFSPRSEGFVISSTGTTHSSNF